VMHRPLLHRLRSSHLFKRRGMKNKESSTSGMIWKTFSHFSWKGRVIPWAAPRRHPTVVAWLVLTIRPMKIASLEVEWSNVDNGQSPVNIIGIQPSLILDSIWKHPGEKKRLDLPSYCIITPRIHGKPQRRVLRLLNKYALVCVTIVSAWLIS
jgi:hypothetical protein